MSHIMRATEYRVSRDTGLNYSSSSLTITCLLSSPTLTVLTRCLAHYISRAAFTGTRITLRQVSPESEDIYDFIIELYQAGNGDWSAVQEKAGITAEDLQHFLEYATQFLGNCGNYKGFGDAKFVPRCDEKVFEALAKTSSKAAEHYKATKGAIFSSDNSGIMHLGYLDEGHMTTYYPDSKSANITKADISAVSDFLEKKGLLVVRSVAKFSPPSIRTINSHAGKHQVEEEH